MPTKTLLPGLFILFILTACGPLVPLSYIKDPANIHIPIGQTIETEEATVFLEYIRSQHGHYIFDLEVINHSSEEMFIAPQFISFYASPKLFTLLQYPSDDVHTLSAPNSALTMKRQFANNPEAIRKIYHEKAKSKEAGAILFALLGAGLMIYDAVKDDNDSQKETWTKKDENKAVGRDILVSVALIATDVAEESAYQAEQDSYYIPFELFPECRIQSGGSVRGKIFIPIESSYRYSRVVVPLGNSDYIFDLKRRGVKTTRSQSPHHP